MPGVDGPVCLTRQAPAEAYAGSLLLFDVVPPDIVSRSGVLSSIVEAGGDARQLEAVTLSEFKAWANTKPDTKAQFPRTDIAHTCSVLKVADALDDRHLEDWLTLTATAIRHDAERCSESGEHGRESGSAPLFSLPEHLQRRLIEKVLQSNTRDGIANLGALLSAWPSHHHAAVVAAAITPGRSLSAPGDQLRTVAKAIASLPAAPPSVMHLQIAGGSSWRSRGRCSSKQTAADVAAAFHHQSSLTHLSIAWFNNEAPVAQAIASLTRLQTLHLGGAACTVALEAVPHLKAMLDSLPCLQDLKLAMSARAATDFELPWKRGFNDDSTDEPQHCLADLLSGATALTSLDLQERQGRRHFVAKAPLSLPCLKQLLIDSDCIATALLSHLSAPLATLEVNHLPASSESSSLGFLQPDDLLYARPLWTSLPQCQQLRSVFMSLNIDSREEDMHSAIREGPAAALAAIPSLHELKIVSSLHMLLCTAQLLAERRSPVQRLSLTTCNRFIYDLPGETPAAWGALLRYLSQLRLQHLAIHTCGRDEKPHLPGMAALQPLTQLTSLHLRGWRDCLHQGGDREALARMQQLRSLRIEGVAVRFDARTPHIHPHDVRIACARSVGQLSRLTELELQTAGRDDSITAEIARQAKPGVWPALHTLSLPTKSESNAESVVRAVAAWPALQVLRLVDVQSMSMIGPRDCDRLKCLASESSVRLIIYHDNSRRKVHCLSSAIRPPVMPTPA